MSEMHLRQPEFMYSACRPLTKNRKNSKIKKKIRDLRYIYRNELDKACFQHGMSYGDFKDLPQRTASDRVLHDKELNIAKNPIVLDIKEVWLRWFMIFFKVVGIPHNNCIETCVTCDFIS